jgi:hypothetical protein
VARQTAATNRFGDSRQRLVFAVGRSDGSFQPLEIVAGVAMRSTRFSWRSIVLERSRATGGPYLAGTPANPVVDRARRVYVTWTGVADGAPVVKLARVTRSGPRGVAVLSGTITGAAVDDAAASPDGSRGRRRVRLRLARGDRRHPGLRVAALSPPRHCKKRAVNSRTSPMV